METIPKTVKMLLECKRLKSDSMVLCRVHGLEWQYWVASPSEGLCVRIVSDLMGDWLMATHNGSIGEKRKALADSSASGDKLGMRDVVQDEHKQTEHFFVEASLFSMDDFQSGYSTAVLDYKLPKA